MARDHARVDVAIWGDDDWRKLSPLARYLYIAILSSPSLNYAGVADWRVGRVAALTGMSIPQVRSVSAELVTELYLVIDEDTEEVLVRSFIRNDGLMKSPVMSVSMAKAFADIASEGIRGVVAHEVARLRGDEPGMAAWGKPQVLKVLEARAIDPTSYPCGDPRANPSVEGQPRNEAYPPPTPTPSPTPTPYSNSIESGEPPKSKRATARPEGFAPNDKHHALAIQRGVNLMAEFAKFTDWCDANGRTYKDWDAGFRTWLNRARPEQQQRLSRQQETDGLFERAAQRMGVIE